MTNDSNSSPRATAVLAPQVAGQFYSGNPVELAHQVDSLLETAKQAAVMGPFAPKAVIVPHAGHRFSGLTAANVFISLLPNIEHINRVVMLGPAHRFGFDGIAVPGAAKMSTPLGKIEIDQPRISELLQRSMVSTVNQAFAGEHCLEVQLPLLQRLLPKPFSIVPLIVGRASPEQVADVIEELWGDNGTLIVVSSDLSHFHSHEQAQQIDLRTQKAIETLDYRQLNSQAACGFMPISGLLRVAQNRGLRVTTLDRCNSSNAGADPNRVVGYGGWRFDPVEQAYTPDKLRQRLITIAAQAIYLYGNTGNTPSFKFNPPDFQCTTARASFITLKIDNTLRGCIGSLQAHRPLCDDVAANAIASAFRDRRFGALRSEEFGQLDIGISILSQATPMNFASQDELIEQLVPFEDGLILTEPSSKPAKRGTFLPMVWDNLPDPEQFFQQLKLKAGLTPDYWSPTLRVARYKAEKFSGKVPAALVSKAVW